MTRRQSEECDVAQARMRAAEIAPQDCSYRELVDRMDALRRCVGGRE